MCIDIRSLSLNFFLWKTQSTHTVEGKIKQEHSHNREVLVTCKTYVISSPSLFHRLVESTGNSPQSDSCACHPTRLEVNSSTKQAKNNVRPEKERNKLLAHAVNIQIWWSSREHVSTEEIREIEEKLAENIKVNINNTQPQTKIGSHFIHACACWKHVWWMQRAVNEQRKWRKSTDKTNSISQIHWTILWLNR